MLILGIDPGTATTGYGVIRFSDEEYDVLEFGLIKTDSNGSPSERLEKIHKRLMKILEKFEPDIMAIEKLFFARNAKTAIRVGQAQGVMLFSASLSNTDVVEYAPGTIKKIVTGNGRADKKAVQKSIRKVLGPKVRSRPKKKTHFDNAADALAVALCHAYHLNGDGKKKEK